MGINYENPIKNLPDAYAKDADSNNYKLLQINKITTDGIRSAINTIFDALNIRNAAGAALDEVWGKRLNLTRSIAETDEHYRLRLRVKMMQDISDGTFSTIKELLAFVLNCKANEIRLVESDTPNRVKIIYIPLKSVNAAGFTTGDITEMVEKMLPICVKVQEENYAGTFEYSDAYEYDESAGYGDVEQTIGGYYGLFASYE